MSLILPRRGVLLGLAAMFAAPAIVRASSLMPIAGEPLREHTFSYSYRDKRGSVHVCTETIFCRNSELHLARPGNKEPGKYYFSNLDHGGPEDHEVTDLGLVIAHAPFMQAF